MGDNAATRPLDGLRAVVLNANLTTAYVGQFLADYGAEVVDIEPVGGHPLRTQAGWPFWGRGRTSIVLDYSEPSDLDVALRLAQGADIVVEAMRPGAAERRGLGYEVLAEHNPGVIYASITAFGRDGRYCGVPGYEAAAMAKMGYLGDAHGQPHLLMVSSATFSAAQLALQGICVALYERETSGRGQRVDTTFLQGLSAHDTWNWMSRHVATIYPDAFTSMAAYFPTNKQGRVVPASWLMFGLLVGMTADGRWLQFAHATTRALNGFLDVLGLGWTLDDEKWKDGPYSDDVELRDEFWSMMLEGVRAKTTEEWQAAFDADTTVFAEVFRHGSEVLHHPQMLHNAQVLEVEGPHGVVREPNPLVRMEATPGDATKPPAEVDEHGAALRAEAPRPVAVAGASAAGKRTRPALDGVTIVELGTFYAAPFGSTMLADLGARVIKLEPLEGDPIRFQMAMPEVAGVRVTSGKESVAVDVNTVEGREIALELVRRADLVLQSFRGGVAQRMGLDAASLRAVNPRLVCLDAPGFGTDGPYGNRPAYAPVINAGSGFFIRNTGADFPSGSALTVDEIKDAALGGMGGNAHADGFSALAVGTALALGLVARARVGTGQAMLTTMLATMSHVLSESVIEYDARPPLVEVDDDRRGIGALYRIYDTADGWVLLAAPGERDWNALRRAAADAVDLDDERFATAASRRKHAGALTKRLQEMFSSASATDWEQRFVDAGVACVAIARDPYDFMDPAGLAESLNMTCTVTHPIFGEHLRMKPLVALSHSASAALTSGVLIGQHTDAVVAELGYTDHEIADLRKRGILGG